MNNKSHIESNPVSAGVRNTQFRANNGVNRPNGVIGNASKNQIQGAIIVWEGDAPTLKRQATVALDSAVSKVPKYVHEQSSNGSFIQQCSIELSSSNQNGFNEYSNNGFFNYVSGPSFENNPNGYGMNNNAHGSGFSNNGYNRGVDNGFSQGSSNLNQLVIKKSKNSNPLMDDCISVINKRKDEKNWKLCRQEAKRGLELLGASDKQKSHLYKNLAFSSYKLKYYEEVKEAYKAGLKIDGASDETKRHFYRNLAIICHVLKDYEGAREACQTGIGFFGASDELKSYLYNSLAVACNELKDYEGAKQACESGLVLPGLSDERKSYFYNNLGFACRGRKDYEGAKQAYKADLEFSGISDERRSYLYNFLAVACYKLKDYEGAKLACEKGLVLPGASDERKNYSYKNLGFACRGLKDYEGVKQACENGLKLLGARDKGKSSLYLNLCFACFKLEDYTSVLKNAAIGLTFSETNIIHKVFFLALLLKCNSEINPSEELQVIAKMLKAFMDIDNDNMKERSLGIKRLSAVISAKEIMERLNMILETNEDSGFQKSVWEQIGLVANMAQRISGIM